MKLITFQYKVIHNVLPNQLSLFRAGIAINYTLAHCVTLKNKPAFTCCTAVLKPPRFGVSSPTGGIKNLSRT